MIELELTEQVKEWLHTDPDQRDILAGAMLLKRINRNDILYNNITRNPKAKAKLLEYHLQRILKARLINATHEQVSLMMTKVDAIAKHRGLDVPAKRSEFQKGKRADHDELPDEIKQLYVDNLDLIRRMRDAHAKLRLINSQTSTCPDSDRLQIATVLIDYDTKYRDNWNVYDHYIKGTKLTDTVKETDSRTVSHNHLKTINMLLGKYAKSPSESLAERIQSLYKQIASPTDRLVKKLSDAGLI